MSKVKFLTNCLGVMCPDLCKDWHPSKNLPLTVTTISYGSCKIVWWQCHVCQYEWQANVNNRRIQYKYPGQPGTHCPNCVGMVINFERSFAYLNPEAALEWHPTKNLPVTPDQIFPYSTNKYYWICKNCQYEWKTSSLARSNNSGCPSCAKLKQFSYRNSK